jgi:hypothetical protein
MFHVKHEAISYWMEVFRQISLIYSHFANKHAIYSKARDFFLKRKNTLYFANTRRDTARMVTMPALVIPMNIAGIHVHEDMCPNCREYRS